MGYLNYVGFDYELVEYQLSYCGHIGHKFLNFTQSQWLEPYWDYEIIKKTSDCIFGHQMCIRKKNLSNCSMAQKKFAVSLKILAKMDKNFRCLQPMAKNS